MTIRPWEVDLLTMAEFYGMCDYIDKRNEELSSTG